MNLISADTWGRFMKPNAPRMVASRITEMTVHYTGAKSVRHSQDQIASRIKATERFHMGRDSNMSGIAYNFAIDKWGRIWELRGFTYQNAANGTSSNKTSFSVNCLVGVEDNEPTPEMVAALQTLYAEGCRRFGRTLIIKGHQEHKPTACPGPSMMALVRSGRIQQGATVAPAPTPAPQPTPTPSPAPSTSVYTVARGDSYWGIAARQLGSGSRWKEVSALNGGKALYPGMVIQIPTRENGTPVPSTPTPAPTTPATYTVQRGDSYWRIALKTLGKGSRWREIALLNDDKPLHPGDVIRVRGE